MENTTDKRKHLALKRTIGIISFIVFLGLMVWVTLYIGIPLIRELFGGTEATEDGVRVFSDMVAENPVRGRLIYVGIQILQVFIAFIPGEAVEIAGGLAFGAIEGLALSLLGVAIGSSVIFLLTKTLGVRFVELFVSRDKIDSMRFIRDDARLNSIVFLVFFIPGTPKDILTYFVGMTRMKLHTFLLLSLTARIPSVITSTWGGHALMSGDYRQAIWIFGITAVVSAVGLIIYNIVSKKRAASAAQEQKEAE